MKHESERARSVHRASEPWFHPCLRAALAAAVILAFSTPIFAQSAKNKKPAAAPQPKSEREQANAQVFGRLAQAWAAAFSGKSQEAIALAEPVAKLSDPDYKWAAIEAAHLQARAYHQSGTAQGRARAAQLWKQIERLDTSKATKARLQIAKALEAEARGTAIPAAGAGAGSPAKPAGDPSAIKQAIDTLEPLLKAGRWNLVEAEAALDLSRLYVQANRFDDAKKTLDYIVAYLGVKKNLIVMEIPAGLEKPYIAAAKAALAHLKYDKNIGLAEFEAAEKLRKAGKFADAARAYQAVIAVVKNFPESDYGPRSDLHVGDCLLGLGQTARAIDHWKKFIAPAPAGPWRGQAYIGIIDYCLEEQLDLPEAGKYADLARNSLPAALRSPEGKAGWQLVAFDIQLRVGLVSFCQGQTTQAVAAFEAAKAATNNKATAESLDALIAAAKSGKAVIPEDCRGMGVSPMSPTAVPAVSSSDKPALALSMGIIHLLAGRYDNADNMFDRVLGTDASRSPIRNPQSAIRNQLPPLGGSSPAQLAFSAFGRGAVLHAQRKAAPAKDLFLASIKAFPAGSWQDETFYRVATITQAEAGTGPKAKEQPATSGKPGESAKDSPKPEIRNPQSAIRNQERLAAFLKAKSAALPYWQEIISRYPQSPRCEQAFYNAGVLLCEIAEAADAPGLRSTKSEAGWKDAAFMLGRFTEFYPKSLWAGDAYVREIDIALERMFDLALAGSLGESAIVWIDRPNATGTTGEADHVVTPWVLTTPRPSQESMEHAACSIIRLNAFILFVMDQPEKAKERLLHLRKHLGSSPQGEWDDYDRLKWGFEHGYFYAYPYELKLFVNNQRLAVLLADYHYITMNFERSASIAERLLSGECGRLTPEQSSYIRFLNGSALCWQGQREAGLDQLRSAYGLVRPTDKNVSLTQDRAMYSAARAATSLPDERERQWGQTLLRELATCKRVNEFTGKAQIAYGVTLLEQGFVEEGTAVLENVAKSNPPLGQAAAAYLKVFRQYHNFSPVSVSPAERKTP